MIQGMAGLRQLRDALLRLHDVPHLQSHALAAVSEQASKDPMARGRALQQRLLDAIESLRPASGTPGRPSRRHQLLLLRYVDALDVPAVCGRLGISRTEYYREHQEGIEALAQVLAINGTTSAPPAVSDEGSQP